LLHVTNFKTSSSTKALQNLCTKLRTKLCKGFTKSSTKGFVAPLPTQCTGHAVNGARSAQGGPRESPPWSFALSPIRSYKALLTRSTNILGRFCNRSYNRLYDQSPYNCLYERLYERLHDRPYERPYNRSINQLPIWTPI
jgi:hypothetical protein